MALYSGTLEGSTISPNDQEFTAGSAVLSFTFSWPENEQVQYDTLIRNIGNKAKGDPLVVENNYVRDYDYLDYYLNMSEETKVWPISLQGKTQEEREEIITQRILECEVLKEVKDQYEELLCWNFRCDDGTRITTGLLRLGGWFCWPEGNPRFRFISSKEQIGREDLQFVTIEVLTDE